MAMTSTERQRAYRVRQAEQAERLSVLVSVQAKRQLERIARQHGISQRATLEMLLAHEERSLLAQLDDTAPYYAVTR